MVKNPVSRLRGASIRRRNAMACGEAASKRARGGEHRFGVAGHAYISPHLRDAPGAVDQEGGAQNAHEAAAVHRLLAPDAISLKHLLGFVGGERDSNLML